MANDLSVKLTLRAEGEQEPESAEIIPTLGGIMEFSFGNAETTWSLDYRKPDRFRLRIDGSVGLVRTSGLEITAAGRFTRDFIDSTTTLDGSLELEFNRNIEVEITGSTGPTGSSVGAGIVIAF